MQNLYKHFDKRLTTFYACTKIFRRFVFRARAVGGASFL